jgi:hypothetical protein
MAHDNYCSCVRCVPAQLDHRTDGWYARADGTDWLGPWNTSQEAVKYFRLVFFTEG